MDLVEVFVRDYVAADFCSCIVSREEALLMSLLELRRQVRQAIEVYVAAKSEGDSAAQTVAFDNLCVVRRELQRAVLRENGLGVSKADEPAGKSKELPARK